MPDRKYTVPVYSGTRIVGTVSSTATLTGDNIWSSENHFVRPEDSSTSRLARQYILELAKPLPERREDQLSRIADLLVIGDSDLNNIFFEKVSLFLTQSRENELKNYQSSHIYETENLSSIARRFEELAKWAQIKSPNTEDNINLLIDAGETYMSYGDIENASRLMYQVIRNSPFMEKDSQNPVRGFLVSTFWETANTDLHSTLLKEILKYGFEEMRQHEMDEAHYIRKKKMMNDLSDQLTVESSVYKDQGKFLELAKLQSDHLRIIFEISNFSQETTDLIIDSLFSDFGTLNSLPREVASGIVDWTDQWFWHLTSQVTNGFFLDEKEFDNLVKDSLLNYLKGRFSYLKNSGITEDSSNTEISFAAVRTLEQINSVQMHSYKWMEKSIRPIFESLKVQDKDKGQGEMIKIANDHYVHLSGLLEAFEKGEIQSDNLKRSVSDLYERTIKLRAKALWDQGKEDSSKAEYQKLEMVLKRVESKEQVLTFNNGYEPIRKTHTFETVKVNIEAMARISLASSQDEFISLSAEAIKNGLRHYGRGSLQNVQVLEAVINSTLDYLGRIEPIKMPINTLNNGRSGYNSGVTLKNIVSSFVNHLIGNRSNGNGHKNGNTFQYSIESEEAQDDTTLYEQLFALAQILHANIEEYIGKKNSNNEEISEEINNILSKAESASMTAMKRSYLFLMREGSEKEAEKALMFIAQNDIDTFASLNGNRGNDEEEHSLYNVYTKAAKLSQIEFPTFREVGELEELYSKLMNNGIASFSTLQNEMLHKCGELLKDLKFGLPQQMGRLQGDSHIVTSYSSAPNPRSTYDTVYIVA